VVRFVAVAVVLVVSGAWGADKPRIAVLPFTSSEGTTRTLRESVAEQVASELTASGRVEAVGSSDIAVLLGVDRQKQLLGCDAENTCMAEMSAALGAPWLLTGNLGRAGKTLRIDVKLLRASDGKAVFRSGESLDDESELFHAVSRLVHALLAAMGVGELPRAGASFSSVGPWVATGLGVVAVGVGVGFFAQASGLRASLLDPAQLATQQFSVAQRNVSAVNTSNTVGEAFAIGGGVVALGGLTWLLINRLVPGTPVALVPNGAGVALVGAL
jgi:TolB-like protein